MSRRIFLSTGLCLLAIAIHAKDWPEFRGPSGQGLAEVKKIPLEWSATHNVAWKQVIPGLGWSSPVLKDGRLYLTTAVSGSGEGLARQTLRALCLDEGSGKILWNVEVFGNESGKAQQIHKKNSHASPTPLVVDGRVYVHFGHQG